LAISRQCELAGVTRSTFYAPLLIAVPDEEKLILALIDAEYPTESATTGESSDIPPGSN